MTKDEGPPDDELCACGNPNCMGIHGFGGAQRVALPPPGSPPCHRCATLEEEVRHLRYGYTEDDAKALGGALQVALHDFPTRCSVKSADFHNRLLVELLRLRVRVERAAALSGGSAPNMTDDDRAEAERTPEGTYNVRGAAPPTTNPAEISNSLVVDELREAARRVLALEPALRLKIITTADRERQAAIAALGAALARLDGGET